MPAMTTELFRLIVRERAWGRLEEAVDQVEQAEAQMREMTRELDEWRAGGLTDNGPLPDAW